MITTTKMVAGNRTFDFQIRKLFIYGAQQWRFGFFVVERDGKVPTPGKNSSEMMDSKTMFHSGSTIDSTAEALLR